VSTANRSDNQTLVNALNHRLRRQILRAMPDSNKASPRELAERLGEPLGNLSYHVRVLADCGALVLVEEKRVRGTTQHFYRSSVTADWARSLLEDSAWESAPDGR
jgi:DNA-binding transcriptional ArsR family regulator